MVLHRDCGNSSGGWSSRHRVDTRGLERNPIVTLVSTARARVSPPPAKRIGDEPLLLVTRRLRSGEAVRRVEMSC